MFKIFTFFQSRFSNACLDKLYEGSFVVFDDMLNYNHRAGNPFFTRGRHKDLDVYYVSESYFWFTRKNNKK